MKDLSNENKIGLILEGGGMRGVFTAGVVDFFLEKDINFANVIGVSAGACHASSFLSKQKGRAFAVATDYLDNKEYCSVHNLIKTGDMFGAEFVFHDIPLVYNPADNETFKNNPTTFQAGITNCETGEAEYPYITDLNKDTEIVRASCSLPLLANIVELNGKKYMDGGIADSIPIRQSIKEGYKKNVVVLTQPRDFKKTTPPTIHIIKSKYKEYPKFVEANVNRADMYNDTLAFIRSEEEKGNALVIAPPENLGVKRTCKDMRKLENAYKLGYEAAKEKYNDLLEFLK